MSLSKSSSKSIIYSETEIEMHRIIYNWDINNFDRICTPESDDFDPISSTPFRAGQEINRESEWDLILSAEGGYLQIWLYLKKIFNEMIKDISVNLTVLLLKADGSTLLRRRCDKNQTFTEMDNGWGMGYIITIETLWEEKDNYLIENKLRLQIQLDILGETTSKCKVPGTGILIPPRTLQIQQQQHYGKRKRMDDQGFDQDDQDPGFAVMKRDMTKLFKSHHESDIKIECGKKTFPVHKLILSARSKVFSAMFKHDTIERRSQSVIVPDVPESTMERMLEYVYSGSVKLSNDVEETMSLVEASDKYQLNELKNRCLRSLCTQITQDNVGKIAIISYLHNAELMIQEEIRHYCRSNWDSLLKKKPFKDCLISSPRAFFDELNGLSSDSE